MKNGQLDQQVLLDADHPATSESGPVTCLGLIFPNDEARRQHFLGILREKLKDPEFRKIEGFPIGSDEDILALSDPPYYTACPNPFIADFIQRYGKPYDPETDDYRREPFAADVREGKNDPIYNAHSYHTKVPHKAIMRYILHYTEPGDIVFDGFCGTGMTGVAAQMCGDKAAVESLGYRVDENGTIYQQETSEDGKTVWKPFSKLGARRAVLNDLSPAATFIAYNYNTPVDVQAFEREAKRILKEVEDEFGWMYKTVASQQASRSVVNALADEIASCRSADEIRIKLATCDSQLATINYTVWSDVFVCPDCTQEVVFWEAAVDKKAGKVHDGFPCPHCGATLTKRRMERAWVTKYDQAIQQTIRQAKQVPVLINYSVGRQRLEKTPDAFDLALIEKIEQLEIPYWFPANRMRAGKETRRNDPIGITHVHHFYTKRTLFVLAALWEAFRPIPQGRLAITSVLTKTASKLHNIGLKNGKINLAGALPNALYIPASIAERNIFELISGKIEDFSRAKLGTARPNYVQTASLTETNFSNAGNIIDYIFVDPPFGSNLNYSELSHLWESWLKVWTNNIPEAIENSAQDKDINDYRRLLTACFSELYRLLKPGRWMTVEFSNTAASIWNCIQTALSDAGFVVAHVAALHKGQGTFMSQTTPTAVKQDLVISAYKPNGSLEERFKLEAGTEEGVWDFVRTHLKQLPVFVSKDGQAEVIAERQNYLLFDRMVAFHVQRGVTVPLSAAEFYAGLVQRFAERDGMYFLPEQLAEYDKKRMTIREVLQLDFFVTDEASAIQWLKQQLLKKPQTFQELHPQFLKEIGGWQKHEKPLELSELLEQNFLRYDGKGSIPPQIVSWLKQSEEMRNAMQDALASGTATEQNGTLTFSALSPQSSLLITRAKDRWYVPDPNKAGDLEKLREKALLKEFEEYRASRQKRLKVFRLEAVRAGFKKAWQERDYATIITVARKIPENVLQEDPKLLMWYDQAVTRIGG